MAKHDNPALTAFLADLPAQKEFAQVRISRSGETIELRHVADSVAADAVLETVEIEALRALASNTDAGAFRPLKSAPNLRTGWRAVAQTAEELERGLDHLYPGALADWYAARHAQSPVTHYRDYVNRQTGMYRITQMLTDGQVRDLAQAGCHRDSCLKQRLWCGPELAADEAKEKSVIPCLEPCAMLLEFARKSMRLEQEAKAAPKISAGDLETLLAAVNLALARPATGNREADFSTADNPRRLRRLKIQVERWLAEVPQKVDKE